MGQGAPRVLVRGREAGQASREDRAGPAARAGRRLMKTGARHKALGARALAIGLTVAIMATGAWAKTPPPPPLDDKAKAAAEEKKAKDAAAAEKAKADQAAAEDYAIKNYQGNMKKQGKPVPKPTPVAPAAVAAAAPTA